MAAGLSIDPGRIPEFRRALSRTVRGTCARALSEAPVLQIDGYVDLRELSLEFVEQMERLAPFGAGNPPLTLAASGLSLKSHTTVGRLGEHLRLIVEDEEGATQQVLWWRAEPSDLPQGPFDLAYAVRASDYRGQRQVQLEWINARPIEKPGTVLRPKLPTIEVVDHRGVPNPHRRLERLRAGRDLLVWSEADAEVVGRDRYALGDAAKSSEELAIWSAPPGPRELRDALLRVSPQTVYLFGIDPGLDQPRPFLMRLARLVKRAVRAEGGRVQLSVLAAATAQREETVRTGLAWLVARGDVVVLEEHGEEMWLAAGEGDATIRRDRSSDRARGDLSRTASRLRSLLEETAAYRAYFARADAEMLINDARSA
jgi:single-stranded-DNA-specific exonuclease